MPQAFERPLSDRTAEETVRHSKRRCRVYPRPTFEARLADTVKTPTEDGRLGRG
jgi:hypothetical protein